MSKFGVVHGKVTKAVGNFMPCAQGDGQTNPLSVPIYVFTGKIKEKDLESKGPKYFMTRAKQIITSDGDGHYRVELDPGTYTLMLNVYDSLYLNSYVGYDEVDKSHYYRSIEVKENETIENNICDDLQSCC